jgi:ubiquitin C-terminal hydrolase
MPNVFTVHLKRYAPPVTTPSKEKTVKEKAKKTKEEAISTKGGNQVQIQANRSDIYAELVLTIPAAITMGTQSLTYELIGFVMHHGDSAQSGHYTSCVKRGNQWFHVNDGTSTAITMQEVAEYRKTGYLYTYQKI